MQLFFGGVKRRFGVPSSIDFGQFCLVSTELIDVVFIVHGRNMHGFIHIHCMRGICMQHPLYSVLGVFANDFSQGPNICHVGFAVD
jgi:hypothetical protein